MTDTLHKAEKLLSQMSRAEKAQVLQWVARDLGEAYPGIESVPGVNGGEPCIVRTNAWAYYRAFRMEIDTQIAENEAA